VALVSADDLATIGGIFNRNQLDIAFGERQRMLEMAQEVLRQVAQSTEPASVVQRVCDHPVQLIALQKQITDLDAQQCLLPQCDHAKMENRI